MKLYSHQVSPYTRLVEITALVSKQKLEIQNVALFTGEQNEDWFLKINPKPRSTTSQEFNNQDFL